MPSVNEVILMGHLGRDAETGFTPSGVACTKFSLATTRAWKPEGSDEWKEATDWHNIVAWRLHEKTVNALLKGALVYVRGRLQTREYEKDGERRWITEVVAQQTYFLRMPLKNGPRDQDAPPAGKEVPPPDDDDIPF